MVRQCCGCDKRVIHAWVYLKYLRKEHMDTSMFVIPAERGASLSKLLFVVEDKVQVKWLLRSLVEPCSTPEQLILNDNKRFTSLYMHIRYAYNVCMYVCVPDICRVCLCMCLHLCMYDNATSLPYILVFMCYSSFIFTFI